MSTAPRNSSPQSGPGRAVWIPFFEAASVTAFALAWLGLAWQLSRSPATLWSPPAMILAGLLGYLLADALSGLVHWFADSFFDEQAPVLGPLLIEPFREHHRDALGITRHGFLEVCGNNCAACLIPLGLTWGLMPAPQELGGLGSFLVTGVLSASFFLFATNAFHRWAHMSEPPAWVTWLQRHHLILSPEHHALHHAGNHDRAYCVTSGWLNPLLDRARFSEREKH